MAEQTDTMAPNAYEAAPEFRISLTDTGIPEVLSAIERLGVDGTLTVSRGLAVKELSIDKGNIVNAASTDLRDSLGAFLEKSGMVSREVLAKHTEAGGSGLKLGERLVAADVLTPGQVRDGIRGQMCEIVLGLFEWSEGEASFQPGEPAHRSGVGSMPLRPLIYEGIQNLSDPGRILGVLGGPESVLRPVHRPEDSIRLDLSPQDLELLRSVNGYLQVEELAASGPHMYADNLRRLYAFALLGLVESGQPAMAGPEAGRDFKVRIGGDASTESAAG